MVMNDLDSILDSANTSNRSKGLARALKVAWEALERYGEQKSYIHDAEHRSEIDNDAGEIARAAIGEIHKITY